MIAVILIIFIGITLFSACVMSYKNLQIFKDAFYENYNFLDAYIDGIYLDSNDVEYINSLRGVSGAEGRMELEGLITLKNETNANVKVIAYTDRHEINQLKLVTGEYLSDASQILVSKNFAEFNNLTFGNTITVKMLEKEMSLKIAGIVESPEFIITIKSRDYVTPSIEDYGIIYVSSDMLRDTFGFPKDVFNQIHFKLDKNADIDFIEDTIDDKLGDRFIYFTAREDQISEVMAREDISMIADIGYMFPIMFLFAAALVIFVMQKKLIDLQRKTIGVLKAIGYSNRIIISYYIKQSCVLGTVSSGLSILPSYFLSIYITKIYSNLVYIPISEFHFNWYVIGFAVLLSNSFSIGATLLSVKTLLTINAAEAMRTAAINETNDANPLKGLGKNFKSDNKIFARNIIRNPLRTVFSIICYIIAFTLFAAPIFLNYSVRYVENTQYGHMQYYDYKVVFKQPLTLGEITLLFDKYDFHYSDLILEYPIEISNGDTDKIIRIIGVDKGYSVFDGKRTYAVPSMGILVPKTVMRQLDAAKGNEITIDFISEDDKKFDVIVVENFDQYIAFNAFMEIDELRRLLKLDDVYNGMYVIDHNAQFASRKNDIEDIPYVRRIDSVERERSEFKTMLKLVNVFILVMTLFGLLMGFSSSYNSTMINVIDRRKEWGMLKILGYSSTRILKMSFYETITCFLLSLIPSVAISIAVCYILGILMSNDFYTNPFIIQYELLLYPPILGMLISLVSVIIYYYSIRNTTTSEVIKVRD